MSKIKVPMVQFIPSKYTFGFDKEVEPLTSFILMTFNDGVLLFTPKTGNSVDTVHLAKKSTGNIYVPHETNLFINSPQEQRKLDKNDKAALSFLIKNIEIVTIPPEEQQAIALLRKQGYTITKNEEEIPF